MTSLPSGLASISSQFDDSPQVRGAVAFGKAQAKKRERQDAFNALMDLGWWQHAFEHATPDSISSAIDSHAALVIGAAYRSADRR